MAASTVYLTVDVGTQSLRACLIDQTGTILCKERIEFDPPDTPEPGVAEYPAEKFWQTFINAVKPVSAFAAANNHVIAALGVTCQRASVVALDERGEALRPVLLWADQRRCEPPDTLGLIGLGMKLIGVHKTVQRFQADAEINYLSSMEPNVWKRVDKLLFLSGYFSFRLTGRYTDSVANQVGYVPFDYRRQDWARPTKWHWKALPNARRELLPDLVRPGEVLGNLAANVATELQLERDLPVVACATDKACEVLGTGCIEPNQACMSLGTAATVNVTSNRYTEIERFVPAYPAACPGYFLCEEQIYRGFWLVNWFKNEFATEEIKRAAIKGVTAESLFDEYLANTAPGSDGLIAQPYWSPGVRIPGPEARGALIGFNDSHGRAHVYRAIIEGLLYSMRAGLEKIARRTGTPIETVRVAGGGSQSDEVLQLAANVIGQPVERAHTFEASSVGAAICCSVACKHSATFKQATATMTRPGKLFHPAPAEARLYNSLYTDVYSKMYAQLQPLYLNIARYKENARNL